jgi:chemotaxis protein methyltransferase WspC
MIDLLADGGQLFVGHAEALETMDPRFRSAGVPGSFAYLRRAPAAGADGGGAVAAPARSPVTRPMPGVVVAPARPRPALPPPPRRPLELPAPSRLDLANELADRGELGAARALCEEQLRESGPDARTFTMLGVIRQSQGDLAAAEDYFARAVYLEPAHYQALVHLALLVEQRGDAAAAANLRRRAARARGGANK